MSVEQITFHLFKTECERRSSIAFAREMAYKWYQSHPSAVPELIFAVKDNNQVVSTVGITNEIANDMDGGCLPIRKLYDFDAASLPADCEYHNTIQLSWFFSSKKGCFTMLLLRALTFSRDAGKKYALLQMKTNVFDILSGKGLRLTRVKGAKLKLNHAEMSEGYYQENTPVHLYYLDIADNICSIQAYAGN